MEDKQKKATAGKTLVEMGKEKCKEVRGKEEDKRTKTKNELKCMMTNMRSLMNKKKGKNSR